MLDDHLGVGIEPEVLAGGGALAVGERAELVGVDTARDHRDRQVAARRHVPPRLPGSRRLR